MALPPEEEPLGPADGVQADAPAAVLVVHGMGQQRRHATLADVVRGIRKTGRRSGTGLRTVRLDGQIMQRAEATVDERPVHIYESYWAGITTGKTTLRETMGFLARAGIRGVRNCTGTYHRHAFNRTIAADYPRARTAVQYTMALFVLGALVVLNMVGAAVIGALALQREAAVTTAWPGLARFEVLSWILVLLLGASAAFGAGLAWMGRQTRRARAQQTPVAEHQARRWMRITMAYPAIVVVLAVAAVLALVVRPPRPEVVTAMPNHVYGFVAAWIAFAIISWRIRGIVVDFVGDVATYVGGTHASRHGETRDRIQAQVARDIRLLLSTTDGQGRYKYSRVAVVGHSLGSVVAYDALNRVLLEDTTDVMSARERLRLLTLGSPLDKLAFLYGFYKEDASLESYLALCQQPMILDYGLRVPWTNVHAPADTVSGALDLYDCPSLAPHGGCVRNVSDPWATTPLMAHIEYWSAPTVWEELRHLIATPMDAPSQRPASAITLSRRERASENA